MKVGDRFLRKRAGLSSCPAAITYYVWDQIVSSGQGHDKVVALNLASQSLYWWCLALHQRARYHHSVLYCFAFPDAHIIGKHCTIHLSSSGYRHLVPQDGLVHAR